MSTIAKLHHVNVLTANLDLMRGFYRDVLGLNDDWRPPFDSTGAWLYLDQTPVVHLVEHPDAKDKPVGRLEHYAFYGNDLTSFLAKLQNNEIKFDVVDIPQTSMQSVNLCDPDGNHIEVLFSKQS